jgi:hypothetical protein
MDTFYSRFLQIRHFSFAIISGLVVCISLCPKKISAGEQKFLNNEFSTYEIDLQVKGQIKFAVQPDLHTTSLEITEQPVRATSALIYQQHSVDNKPAQKRVVFRIYQRASAKTVIGSTLVETELPEDMCDVHVCSNGRSLDYWVSQGFLTQPETDLLTVAFDPLHFGALIPPDDSLPGDRWEVGQAAVANLLCIDTVHTGVLKATVKECTTKGIVVNIQGAIEGAINGAPTSVAVEGDYDWISGNNSGGELSALRVVIQESRTVSYIAPGIDVTAIVEVSCRSGKRLRPKVITAGSRSIGPNHGRPRRGPGKPGFQWICDPHHRYDIIFDKNWKIVEQSSECLTMRLVNKGALVSQVTVTPLPPRAEVHTLSDFEEDIEKTLGPQFGHLVSASLSSRDDGTTLMRVASVGEAEGLAFHWIHYHLRSPEGQRLSLSFVVESTYFARFSDADRQYLDGVNVTFME